MTTTTPVLAKGASVTRPSERWIVILLFGSSFLYLLAFRSVVTMEPDEGIVLQGAQRILEGQVPYRDFFSFYTPGSFYLMALLLRVFGDSILVARTSLVLLGATFPVFTYLLARRACFQQTALVAGILVAVTSTPYRFLVLHNWDSTFWASLSTYSAVQWLESSSGARWAFATGTFASFTFLSEQSKGVGFFLGLGLGLLILVACGQNIPKFVGFMLGALWPVLSTLMYFAWKHSLALMLEDWIWPLRYYSAANRVPYGYQNWSDDARQLLFHSGSFGIRTVKVIAISPGFLVPVLPLIAVALLVYWSTRLRKKTHPIAAHYVLVCAILSGLLLSVVVVRADIIHFVYLAPLFYLSMAWAFDEQTIPGALLRRVRPCFQIYVIAAFGLMALVLLVNAVGTHAQTTTQRGTIRDHDTDAVIQYIQDHVTVDHQLLVYPYLPLYNYLTATRSPSRFDYFQPGMNTNAQAQEIIHSLETKPKSPVLFEASFADKIPVSWPGTPPATFAYDPIAGYIVRNYQICKILKSPLGVQFEYMVRKDQSCP